MALDLHEYFDDKKAKAKLLNRIGSIYRALADNENALLYYEKALKIREQIGYKKGVAGSLNNVANVFLAIDSLDKALKYYYDALQINNEMGNMGWKAVNLHNMAIIYDKKGDLNKALEFFKRSLAIKEYRKDYRGIALTQNSIGYVHYKMKNYDDAIVHLEKSLEMGLERKLRENIILNYSNLSIVYFDKTEYKKAYEYLELYSQSRDSLLNEEKVLAVAEFEAKYKTEQKEKENTILKNNLLLAGQKEERRRNLQILLFITVSALLITTLFIVFNFRLRKKSLEKDKRIAEKDSENYRAELEFRNMELVSNAMYLAQMNELTNNIINDIRELSSCTNSDGKKTILKIIRELNNKSKNNAWKEFETRFENVHSSFYGNITEKFPELSPTDRKMCAFLRLNMTTKDIASITYQSIRGVESARQRLRKKLDITPDTNLVNYLTQF